MMPRAIVMLLALSASLSISAMDENKERLIERLFLSISSKRAAALLQLSARVVKIYGIKYDIPEIPPFVGDAVDTVPDILEASAFLSLCILVQGEERALLLPFFHKLSVCEKRLLVAMRDEHGRTLLHWSAANERTDIAEAILGMGAEMEAKDAFGGTTMDWSRLPVAAFLLRVGVTADLMRRCEVFSRWHAAMRGE